jgi:hypothetical protein
LSTKSKGITKEQFNKLLKSLNNIESKLDILVSFQRLRAPKVTTGEEQEKILALCDKKHTITDMMQSTNKTNTNVKGIIFDLKKKGLIKSIRIGKKTVYERIR